MGVGQPIMHLPEAVPTRDYDDDFASEYVQPVAEIMPMMVHDFESPRSTPPPVYVCKHNEYEITIAMGSDLWSGTDDEVEIRLYFLDGSVSEWFDLRIPMYNAFERLAIDSFCVRPQQGTLQKLSFIGLRKFGRDQMKIEAVMVSTNFSSSIFN